MATNSIMSPQEILNQSGGEVEYVNNELISYPTSTHRFFHLRLQNPVIQPEFVDDIIRILNWTSDDTFVKLEGYKIWCTQSQSPVEPQTVLDILKDLSDDEITSLGYDPKDSRPEWMIWKIMPIPAISLVENNDIIMKIRDIVRTNYMLKNCDTPNKKNWSNLLQYHVASYIDNSLEGMLWSINRRGEVLKMLKQRPELVAACGKELGLRQTADL